MHRALKDVSFGWKITILVGLLVAATVGAMFVASFVLSRALVDASAEVRLQSVAELKHRQVETFLTTIDRDLRLRAQNPLTAQALIAFTDAFETLDTPTETLQRVYIDENPHPTGEKDQLLTADTGSNYGFIHTAYHPALHQLQREMRYYDVFLFDTADNLVYSVFKELDFATNVLTGPWKDSGLAMAYRGAAAASADDPATFIDFAPYAPSADAPAAFIATAGRVCVPAAVVLTSVSPPCGTPLLE